MIIKSCPCCRSKAEHDCHTDEEDWGHFVSCTMCNMTTGLCETEAEAIKTWNNRANPWIKCEENRPDSHSDVFISLVDSELVTVARLNNDNGKKLFWFDVIHRDRLEMDEVSHWAPIDIMPPSTYDKKEV